MLKKWFARLFKSHSAKHTVTLRNVREPGNVRTLTATLIHDGALRIEGMDYGDAVEEYFGERVYEWKWTISPPHVQKLAEALASSDDILIALAARFQGEAAADLHAFLDAHQITYEPWSRTGS